MRISRDQLYMEMARSASKRSTCCRLNVGAIITLNNSPVSLGYNGPPAGEPHCLGNECPVKEGGGCERSLHAEANAIDRLPSGLDRSWKKLYVTHSPCIKCAEKIPDAFISHVFYEVEYRKPEGIQYLVDKGIIVYQYMPSGYLVDKADNLISSPA